MTCQHRCSLLYHSCISTFSYQCSHQCREYIILWTLFSKCTKMATSSSSSQQQQQSKWEQVYLSFGWSVTLFIVSIIINYIYKHTHTHTQKALCVERKRPTKLSTNNVISIDSLIWICIYIYIPSGHWLVLQAFWTQFRNLTLENGTNTFDRIERILTRETMLNKDKHLSAI